MALSFRDSLIKNSLNRNQISKAAFRMRAVDMEGWTPKEGYDVYDEYKDDVVSIVDDAKNIEVADSQINLSQEENSQFIPFEMSRYYDGFDLTETNIFIHFVGENGNEGFSKVVNVYYNDDKIRFAWLVDRRVTAASGKLKFEIECRGENSKGEMYCWKTNTNDKLNIKKSLCGDGIIKPDKSWLSQFTDMIYYEVKKAADAASKAYESAKSAAISAQKAESVQIETEGLQEAVEETKASAESAKSSADAALVSANDAKTSSDNALKHSEDASASAQSAAESVDAATEIASGVSRSAQSTSESATNASESADRASESVRIAKEAEEAAKDVAQSIKPIVPNQLKGKARGIVAHVDDAYPGKLLGVTIHGETIQNLWVPGSTRTVAGITFTVQEDGGVHVSGTSTQQYTFMDIWVEGTGMLVKNQTYTMSGWSNNVRCLVGFFTAETTNIGEINMNKPTGKVPTATEKVLYRVGIYTQGLTVDEVVYPMFVLGDKPKQYVKPGPLVSMTDNLSMEVTGRNFARIDNNLTKIPGGVFINTTKRIINPGEYVVGLTFNNYVDENRVTELIFENDGLSFKTNNMSYGVGIGVDLVPGETYTLSAVKNNEYFKMSLAFYLVDGTFISYHKGGSNVTVPINAARSVLVIRGAQPDISSQSVSVSGIQIEVGSNKNTYKPYVMPSNTFVDLQGNTLRKLPNNIADIVQIDGDGNVSLTKAVEHITFDGSEDWKSYNAASGKYFEHIPANDKLNKPAALWGGICSKLPTINPYDNDGGCFYNYANGSGEAFRVRPPAYANVQGVEAFKAWLAADPIEIMYAIGHELDVLPLGKIDFLQLPEVISNAHVNANIPVECEIKYVRDINVVVEKLEAAIAKTVDMLSMMDTPTVIPEQH